MKKHYPRINATLIWIFLSMVALVQVAVAGGDAVGAALAVDEVLAVADGDRVRVGTAVGDHHAVAASDGVDCGSASRAGVTSTDLRCSIER